jgi:hypothetical protein
MIVAFMLLLILAATLLIGWLVTWWDRKHPMQLGKNQIRNLGLMVENMKKYMNK